MRDQNSNEHICRCKEVNGVLNELNLDEKK